jgi:hypothetical protein
MRKHALSATCIHQIQQLLKRSSPPLVEVRKSPIPGAGSGVFVRDDSNTVIDRNQVICLYPGVYSAGLPLSVLVGSSITADNNLLDYLGQLQPPSGVDVQENAYILNLQSVGGYLDGLALFSPSTQEDDDKQQLQARRLDENPNACGHLINHRPLSARENVTVVSFYWTSIWDTESLSRSQHHHHINNDDEYYRLPNASRSDCAPWYIFNDEIVHYDSSIASCGAALVALRRLERGEELYMDYAIKEPYPAWAKSWYMG